ncbi:MAG: hypothetical protein COB17_08910 [Sulfurimonas sp.]|nr:MAG: hypothetical protein COB17_08910 [Sulfurimonas sp.]
MAFSQEDITSIYVATFNRAPDSAGLNYWMNDSGFDNIEDIASSFFDSAEAQEMYADSTTSSELVQTAYQNLFSREADAEGLQYWTNALDDGSISQSFMLQAMINGAQNEDALIIQNKTTVGMDYASRDVDDIQTATDIMQNITYDSTSIEDAYSLMNSRGYNYAETNNEFKDEDMNGFNDFNNDNLGGFSGSMFGGNMLGGANAAYIYTDTYSYTDANENTSIDLIENTIITGVINTDSVDNLIS